MREFAKYSDLARTQIDTAGMEKIHT